MDLDTILNIRASNEFPENPNITSLVLMIDTGLGFIDTEIKINKTIFDSINKIYQSLIIVYNNILKYNDISPLNDGDLSLAIDITEDLKKLEIPDSVDEGTKTLFIQINARLECILNAIGDYEHQFDDANAKYNQYCYGS